MKQPWPWLFSLFRRYGLLCFLAAWTCFVLVGYLAHGDLPNPQVPPAGYVVQKANVRFTWDDGGLPPPFVLQLCKETNGFQNPWLEKKVKSRSVVIPIPVQGEKWCWRVIHESTGKTSRTSCFYTAEHLLPL